MAGSKKDEYPKMLYRSDEAHNAQPVLNKDGVFYTVVKDAKAESEAVKNGFRKTLKAK